MSNNFVGLLGFPYDKKSSFLRGPALAPPLIRQSLFSAAHNLYSESGVPIEFNWFQDLGDHKIREYFQIEAIASQFLAQGYALLSLGGDHSISYPLVRAHHEHYGAFDLLQIDAHGDLYDEFEGDRYSHACPFARIMEEGLVNRLVQVGVRSLTAHQREQVEKFGVELVEMKDFSLDSFPRFDHPLYISLDLDGLDPAYAPGVSHQEPGGLSSREVLAILQHIRAPLIGADLVEFNPVRDVGGITASLAGKLARELLVKLFQGRFSL